MAARNKVILFIEGEPNSPNGDLRQGLTKLLSRKLSNKLPRMILGGGKSQTIHKYKTNKLEADAFLLLVDLDKEESTVENDLTQNQLITDKENVFYMIQEMEAWFISQPKVLDSFYGPDDNKKNISEKLTKKNATAFNNPDEELKRLTKNTRRGEYHKIKHAVEILKMLDASKLEEDFTDFKRLIAKMNSL